eukprot:2304733-Pleurochrysis_carterae.AAC.1
MREKYLAKLFDILTYNPKRGSLDTCMCVCMFFNCVRPCACMCVSFERTCLRIGDGCEQRFDEYSA